MSWVGARAMQAVSTIMRQLDKGGKYQSSVWLLRNPGERCMSVPPFWSLCESLRVSWELHFLYESKLNSENILIYDLEGQREGEAFFSEDHYKLA